MLAAEPDPFFVLNLYSSSSGNWRPDESLLAAAI